MHQFGSPVDDQPTAVAIDTADRSIVVVGNTMGQLDGANGRETVFVVRVGFDSDNSSGTKDLNWTQLPEFCAPFLSTIFRHRHLHRAPSRELHCAACQCGLINALWAVL